MNAADPSARASSDPEVRGDAVAVIGNGVVGQRVVKRLELKGPGRRIVRLDERTTDLSRTRRLDQVAVAVLAHPGPHHAAARALVSRGVSVVSVGDRVADVDSMIRFSASAIGGGATLVVGAGMSPGLTGVIARHLAAQLAEVDEIHVAIHGTAGPACARQHHRALAGVALSYDETGFVTSRAGSGRELAWFPEPVGAYDCYRAEMPVARVLHDVFPTVTRITARMSANRRDRFTSRLPMLTPPHPEGGVGAVRVEVRGADHDGGRQTVIGGVAEMVGTAAAATAASYVEHILDGSLPSGLVLPGDEQIDNAGLLRRIVRFGVRLQEFTGVPSA